MTSSQPGVLDCGTTIEAISDYLAHDRIPYDPAIENCPECVNALHALERVSQLSRDLVCDDADRLTAPPQSWVDGILDSIRTEMRAGRDLPLRHDDPRVTLTLTEGAVRTLVRTVGDAIPGLIIGSCRIDGDAEVPNAAVTVGITASAAVKTPLPPLIDRLRRDIADALRTHTELNVTGIDITIRDLHHPPVQEMS